MRIGLVSDAHGHVSALERAIKVLKDAGAEEIIFLGDALGYIDCLDTVSLIVAQRLIPLTGNHDAMILSGTSPPELEDIYRHSSIASALSTRARQAISSWPSSRILYDGAVLAVHGSPSDSIGGYVYPDTNLDIFSSPQGVRIIAMGHTHHAMVRRHNGILFINPGSCALPRDIRSNGSVALFDLYSTYVNILRFDISDLNLPLLTSVHQTVSDLMTSHKC